MKKYVLFFMVFSAGFAFAQSAPGFDSAVNFSVSMKELSSIIENGNSDSLKNKYLILNGAYSSFTARDTNIDSYSVDVEIVNGEWDGVSDVFIYRCIINFKGPQFAQLFPSGRRSVSAGEEIPVNSGLIIVCKYRETRQVGEIKIPVLDGYYLRIYK